MDSLTQTYSTGSNRFTDITKDAGDFCGGKGDGLLNLFVPHATAGLAIFETGAGSEPDAAEMIDRLIPRGDHYTHRHGSYGHGADHLLPIIVSPSTTIPVKASRLLLGIWQSIVLVDPNVDNPNRTVIFSFLSG